MNDNVARYYLRPIPEQSVNPQLIRVYSKAISLEQIAVGDAILAEAMPYKFMEGVTVFRVPTSQRAIAPVDRSNESPNVGADQHFETILFEKRMCTYAEDNRASPVWVRVRVR